ncbi:YdcF family protein [Pseudoduganella violaceinigra]|uniref:YdcF family protein n=1 Tax=Pseudoduganella violaceinigra TaxID=246602 RepID=UPI000421B626|nr:YdcF family protein [Pseudoduganella violaceinigra]
MRLLRRLVLLLAGLFLAGTGLIVAAGCSDRLADADMIIVPGNTVAPDGRPSPRLQARLDAALLLYREHRAGIVFVSGGVGKEGFDEAAVMAAYLAGNGVPPAAIAVDSQGLDTMATARNAAAYMRARGLRSALVATQYFHVPRTRFALERAGVHVAGHVHARYAELRDLYSIPREVAGFISYFFTTS